MVWWDSVGVGYDFLPQVLDLLRLWICVSIASENSVTSNKGGRWISEITVQRSRPLSTDQNLHYSLFTKIIRSQMLIKGSYQADKEEAALKIELTRRGFLCQTDFAWTLLLDMGVNLTSARVLIIGRVSIVLREIPALFSPGGCLSNSPPVIKIIYLWPNYSPCQ